MTETGEPRHSLSISWDRLHADCRLLSLQLRDVGPFKALIAVTRGGLVPAAIVARELSIRRIETIGVASYQGQAAQAAVIMLKDMASEFRDGDGAEILIVDDLVDSGRTMRHLRGLLPRAHFACVYTKPAGRPLIDTAVADVSQDTWIHFPWDLGLSYAIPMVADAPLP